MNEKNKITNKKSWKRFEKGILCRLRYDRGVRWFGSDKNPTKDYPRPFFFWILSRIPFLLLLSNISSNITVYDWNIETETWWSNSLWTRSEWKWPCQDLLVFSRSRILALLWHWEPSDRRRRLFLDRTSKTAVFIGMYIFIHYLFKLVWWKASDYEILP